MITHCPHCDTYFRVSAEQLAAHDGQVRCGRCTEIFNALERLEQDGVNLPTMPISSSASEIASKTPRHKEIITTPAKPTDTNDPLSDIPSELPRKKSTRRQPRNLTRTPWLWLVGILFLIVTLAVQGAYFYRNELVAHNPQLRPLLEGLCRGLQCEIELLKNPDLLNIEASDLVSDPANPDIITVNITLRNRANFPQAHPLLELTLTDAQNALVARRVFKPAEYIGPGVSVAAGMLPKSELVIHLRLQLNNLKAAGYRVYVFYP